MKNVARSPIRPRMASLLLNTEVPVCEIPEQMKDAVIPGEVWVACIKRLSLARVERYP
jgi:hypothetical protein